MFFKLSIKNSIEFTVSIKFVCQSAHLSVFRRSNIQIIQVKQHIFDNTLKIFNNEFDIFCLQKQKGRKRNNYRGRFHDERDQDGLYKQLQPHYDQLASLLTHSLLF